MQMCTVGTPGKFIDSLQFSNFIDDTRIDFPSCLAIYSMISTLQAKKSCLAQGVRNFLSDSKKLKIHVFVTTHKGIDIGSNSGFIDP